MTYLCTVTYRDVVAIECYHVSVYHDNFLFFFFFNDTATTEIYTLSLHDALPILLRGQLCPEDAGVDRDAGVARRRRLVRSEEHTSELQSRLHLVCRLLLEKKKHRLVRTKHQSHSHPIRIQPPVTKIRVARLRLVI